jgi:hypothetical protein
MQRTLIVLLFVTGIACHQDHISCEKMRFAEISSTGRCRTVLFIDERGCLSCTKEFAVLSERYMHAPEVRLVLRANGGRIDIVPFMDAGASVHWDDDGNWERCFDLHSSAAIFFEVNGDVDTIVALSGESLSRDLDYIISRLPSSSPLP